MQPSFVTLAITLCNTKDKTELCNASGQKLEICHFKVKSSEKTSQVVSNYIQIEHELSKNILSAVK